MSTEPLSLELASEAELAQVAECWTHATTQGARAWFRFPPTTKPTPAAYLTNTPAPTHRGQMDAQLAGS